MLLSQKPGALCGDVFKANHAAALMDVALLIDMQGS